MSEPAPLAAPHTFQPLSQPLLLRPLRSDDRVQLQALVTRLSAHSAYMRFHHLMRHLPDTTAHLMCAPKDGRIAWVWERAGDGAIVAVGRCEQLTQEEGELALLVEDAYQGRGLGRQLLSCLITAARANHLVSLHANVMAVNAPVIKLLRSTGLPITAHSHGTTIDLVLHLQPAGTG